MVQYEFKHQSPRGVDTTNNVSERVGNTQSGLRNHPDALRGVFDVSDLDKELEKANKIPLDSDLNIRLRNRIRHITEAKKEERQRLKAEVEKVLDDWFYDKYDSLPLEIYKELKKRLGM